MSAANIRSYCIALKALEDVDKSRGFEERIRTLLHNEITEEEEQWRRRTENKQQQTDNPTENEIPF